ncbi:MAG: Folate-dependent phosphoribosylglycinamide formyltransferase PurN-like protein [Dehalococcoidia bacterium]|nr:Folate-dependent phosphoribosylglycinamide formyltransferase PurN-like protein [Dehalococcoidia bacterium]
MLTLGWFSTGGGEGSRGLLRMAQEAIERGKLQARIQFVFSNREPGEAEGSDLYFQQVRAYGIPLVTCSSQRFRRERAGGPISRHRLEFDREVIRRLEGYEPELCVLAGYMLILGPEMCRRYTMLNLHPALPHGPTGTWQEVIWKLIEEGAEETGAFIHLATEELDRGPALTYCSFPLRGDAFDQLWARIDGRSVEDLKTNQGEELSLFQLIRQEGVRRERPLLLETLKAFATGELRVEGRRALDSRGRPLDGPLCLNEAIERALA